MAGDSIVIFIRCERLQSLKLLRSRVLISFISEMLRSTETVATGMERLMVASVRKFGSFHLKPTPFA